MAQEKPEISEASLRELYHIRNALDQSAIVATTDRAGRIIHVNDKFCRISGYSREELLGKDHRIVNSGYHQRDFFVEMWRTISSGQIWEGEIRNRTKSGKIYWVNTTIVPFLDEKGAPFQYVSIRFEITQRKQAEEQLRVYAEKIEASNRELQDFASIAAHDLQAPLRKIEAFGDRLKIKAGEALVPECRDYLDRMMSSAARMRRLIEDLLTFSRVTTRGRSFQPVDLSTVMREVLSDLEIRVEQVGATVKVDPLPTIDADHTQIRQLFQNLVSNALKFHQPGVAPVVRVSAKVEVGECTLSVADNGIGFEEKYLDRIFTIFQRLHGKQAYEGTGVGLAVCRRIAERHGGKITARSTPGQGAEFLVTLPLKQINEGLNE